MTYSNNMAQIDELGASEGVFTTAQAARLGIPRYALSYAAKAKKIENLTHGVYRLSSSMDDGLDSLRAAYKLSDPAKFTHERMSGPFDGVAVSGNTAAYMLGIGDFYAEPYSITTPKRFNSRRKDVIFKTAYVAADEVVWLEGIPVTRPEKTIADLLAANFDVSLVADAFADAIRKYGSTQFDIRILKGLIGANSLEGLCMVNGIDGTSARLQHLDSLGHVAIVEGIHK